MVFISYLATVAALALRGRASPVAQTAAPDGYWAADIFQSGCSTSGTFEENPYYTFTGKEALVCTSITGYGYQSAHFDDATATWALNVYTDGDCTVPLTEDLTSNTCITSPEGQYVMAISVTRR